MLTRHAAMPPVVLSLACLLAALYARPTAAQTTTVPTTPQAPPAAPPAPPTPTTPPPPKPTAHQVDLKAVVHVTRQGSVYVGRGTFKGKPFSSGSFETRSRVISTSPLRVTVQLIITAPPGRAILNATTKGAGAIVYGKATVTGGTGVYKGITGSGLSVSFTSGASSTVRVRGSVKFIDPVKAMHSTG